VDVRLAGFNVAGVSLSGFRSALQMSWTSVTIARRPSGVVMPERCIYCSGRAERDLPLRARRLTNATKGRLTVTRLEEHITIDVPYCRADAARSADKRREIHHVGRAAAIGGYLLGLALVLALLDAPLGVRIVLGLIAGAVLGLLALFSAGVLVRRLSRYRDWGAGLLGVDLAAGQQAFTFRFSNAAYAALFRAQNGVYR